MAPYSSRASKQEFSFHMVGWRRPARRPRRCAHAIDGQPRQGRRRQLGPLQQSEGRLRDRAGALQQVDDENRRDASRRPGAMDDLGIMPAFPVHDLGDQKGLAYAAHRRVHARVPVPARQGLTKHGDRRPRRPPVAVSRRARLHHPEKPPERRRAAGDVRDRLVGVYAIGNPIDILINPQADQIDRGARSPRSASTSRCGLVRRVPARRGDRRPRPLVRAPRRSAHPREDAGDARARLDGDADRDRARIPLAVGRPASARSRAARSAR